MVCVCVSPVFGELSRRLAEVWKLLPEKDKLVSYAAMVTASDLSLMSGEEGHLSSSSPLLIISPFLLLISPPSSSLSLPSSLPLHLSPPPLLISPPLISPPLQVWRQKAQYLQHKQNKAEATTVKRKSSTDGARSKGDQLHAWTSVTGNLIGSVIHVRPHTDVCACLVCVCVCRFSEGCGTGGAAGGGAGLPQQGGWERVSLPCQGSRGRPY